MKDVLHVPRTDPIYNMHGYLTKVPVNAIIPFIKEFTEPGGTVVDMFAGSGMTALAAKMCSRNAIVSDISILGKHIGTGYLTQVDHSSFQKEAATILEDSFKAVGHFYDTYDAETNSLVTQIRTIWSFVFECRHCESELVYYKLLESCNWKNSYLTCPNCGHYFEKRKAKYLRDTPVKVVTKNLSKKQVENDLTEVDYTKIRESEALQIREIIPNNEISSDREMFRRSALQKWGTTNTRDFFSDRNALILHDLWERIHKIGDPNIRQKLLFCFTAILPRASKRYQWSHKAPLNAANQNYYIAPVFYEWNVYDLFNRKVSAAIKADKYLCEGQGTFRDESSSQSYITSSATSLDHISDESIDLVFTDPPFGSNIFYADMNLFQEAWLNANTNHQQEAVIHTGGAKEDKIKAKIRYEKMLTEAFSEAHRILKPNGVISIVFGNSKGDIWSMAQRAITKAGFNSKPLRINILDKGQRSVKGLSSGTESTATLDLIISYKKVDQNSSPQAPDSIASHTDLISKVLEANLDNSKLTVSHLYLEILREALYQSLPMETIDLKSIFDEIKKRGKKVDPASGHILS